MKTLNSLHRVWLCLVVFLLSASVTNAQRDLKDIPPPDPELERATFKLPDGFEVNLFAADPMIAKPIQMNFDEAGRLWIVSSEVYPHIKPGETPSDRVLVLEDADHDGVSDKTHVFADGLLIPTGIAPGDGGAYVANSTELLHFEDTDGDLKADFRRIVLSGFGTEDTHHILHTLRWGPDGYLYLNQSIYIHSHIETPWGVRRLNAGGIWQFRPETLELGVYMRGLVNTWGHHFDRFGQSFATDGAGGEGINYVVPGAYYFTAADAPEILHGLNPGSPKHCGLEIVETPMLPPDWQGSAITNDFRGHRVCRFNLSEDRSGYVSREQQEVISSDHVAFRPIDVKLGPDGAIYIADWYNPIIQHGEVDFRDPRRDHTHGRIWRVTWKGAEPREWSDLTERSNAELFGLLSSDDNFQRRAAGQLLRQRGDTVIPDLEQWLKTIAVEPATEHLRLEALWCFQSLRAFHQELLNDLLQAEDGRVRSAAVRVLSHWKTALPDHGREWLQKLIRDDHPRVRLEAVRAISFSPNAESEHLRWSGSTEPLAVSGDQRSDVELALLATDQPTDIFLDYAVRLTVRELSSQWLPAFERGEINFGNNLDHILTAFSAIGKGAPVDFLLKRLYSGDTAADQRPALVNLISSSGTAEQISELVTEAAMKEDATTIRTSLNVTRQRSNLRVPVPENVLTRLTTSESDMVRRLGLIATGQWRAAEAFHTLQQVIAHDSSSLADRMAAAEGLALHGGKPAFDLLAETAVAVAQPNALRKHAAALLTGVQPARGVNLAAKLLPHLTVDEHPEDLVSSCLAVKGGDTLLAKALVDAKLDTTAAREMLRVVRESGIAATELENVLKMAGNITSRKQLSDAERELLLNQVANDVTAAEGERVFRNAKLGCLKCHAIGGAGGKVGPDMVSLGGSAQPDYLLESLLNPNAKVKENYHTIVVVTTEGRLLSGVQVKQSKESVDIRTADDKLLTIARSDIDEIVPGLSLMPEGLVDALTDREIASLVRFLSELGRTPEFSISRRRLARTWTVMQATEAAAFRLRRTSYAMAASDDPEFTWQPQYSTVSGRLLLEDIPVVSVRNRSAAGVRGVGFARCTLNVETAGTVVLKLNGTQGLELRRNDVPVDLFDTVTLDLQPGRYRLTFTIDQTQRTQPLELEIATDGTSAVAAFEN
ncbi:MAG: HEAT repeat domain-containing protein [Planctomycetaceae bacterium]